MKILKLTAENIKRLVAVEITPTGEIVTISGKNGAGKTSILDSIWWALSGTSNIQSQPIRKGQQKARIRLDLGEIVVERRFTPAGSTLAVENAEGARFKSPQNMLDALLGALSFDPLAFSRMEPRKQFDELRRISSLDIDIDQLDALNKGDYAKRTDLNRDAKARRAQAEGVQIEAEEPAPTVDEAALVDQLAKAAELNTSIQAKKTRRESAQAQANSLKNEGRVERETAAALRAQADSADSRASQLLEDAAEIQKMIDQAAPIQDLVDVSELRLRIRDAKFVGERRSERARALVAQASLRSEAERLEAQSNAITEAMEAREKAKADAISKAKLPVEGIGFGDGVVTLNGVPFEQASSAEQLRVSMAIAMASNPKLRVIRITDGSLLDEDSLAAIATMAKADDFQVWVEKVDDTGKVGIVIEDGMVKVAVEEPA